MHLEFLRRPRGLSDANRRSHDADRYAVDREALSSEIPRNFEERAPTAGDESARRHLLSAPWTSPTDERTRAATYDQSP